MNQKRKAIVYLLITFFGWGSLYISSKVAMDDVEPAIAVFFRYFIGIIPIALIGWKQLPKHVDKGDWKYFFIIGFLGYFFSTFVSMIGIDYAGASVSSVVNASTPVVISLAAVIILKEQLDWKKILCLILALVGTLVITGSASDSIQLKGIIYSLVAVIFWGIASVYMRKMGQKYNSIAVNIYGMIIGLIFHTPTALITAISTGGAHLTPTSLVALLFLGLLGTALPATLWTKSLTILEASTCSLFYPLQTIFSVILGAIFLEEEISNGFLVGSILIIMDIFLNCFLQMRFNK